MRPIPVQDEGAEAGHEQHLVGIPDHAVRALQTRHQVAVTIAEDGGSPMRRIDVQPDPVAPADIGYLVQRVERPRRRGAGTGNHRHHTPSQFAHAGQLGSERPRIHATPLIQAHQHHLAAAESQDARGPGHTIVSLGVGQEDGFTLVACEAVLPGVAQSYVTSGEERREVGERATVSDGAREAVGLPPYRLTEFPDHSLLHSGGPGPHLVDGHHLVGDRPHRVEQAAERHRSRYLVPDVARVVQVETPLQHHLDQARRNGRRAEIGPPLDPASAAQEQARLADTVSRLRPRQDRALRALGARKMVG